MRKNLINMYQDEERKLNDKMRYLFNLYKTNLKQFNEAIHSDFKTEILPGKSLSMMKVFFRCQLPYEMFVSTFKS